MLTNIYIAIALVAWRLVAGHIAYSLTMTSIGRERWRKGPCFPLTRQDGTESPAWGGGIWRGFLFAAVWPLIPVLMPLFYFTFGRLGPMLTIGNERKAIKRRLKRELQQNIQTLERDVLD